MRVFTIPPQHTIFSHTAGIAVCSTSQSQKRSGADDPSHDTKCPKSHPNRTSVHEIANAAPWCHFRQKSGAAPKGPNGATQAQESKSQMCHTSRWICNCSPGLFSIYLPPCRVDSGSKLGCVLGAN